MSSTLPLVPYRHDARRRLPVRGMFNLRDVGGYTCREGGTTRWRTLLRGDAPHRLTDEDRAVLAAVGLRSVVDLRMPSERDGAPAAWGDLPLAVVHQPILTAIDPEATLETMYQLMILHHAEALTAAVVQVARRSGSPVLVHCSAGKDRTGLVIALILAAIGVGDLDVVADYALTARYLNGRRRAAVRRLHGAGGRQLPTPGLLACPPRLIVGSLARVKRDHGSVRQFLLRHGATAHDLEQLREHLVAPPGSAGHERPSPSRDLARPAQARR